MQSPARLAWIKEKAETLNPRESYGFRPRLLSATNGDASLIKRTNQSRACYGAGQSGTPARHWEKAEGPRQRHTRAARAAGSLLLTRHTCRSTMDAPRQVVNFGPGPAKLPRSVSPSDRARKVQSGREHACEWLSILRGELCISSWGAGIPALSPANALPQRTPSSGSLAGGLLGKYTWGKKLGRHARAAAPRRARFAPPERCWHAVVHTWGRLRTLRPGRGHGGREKPLVPR